MSDINQHVEQDDHTVIEDLLRLPVKNLEDRVRELDKSIQERKQINDEIMTRLCTQRRRFRKQKKQLRYAELTDFRDSRPRDIDHLLSHLEHAVREEKVGCFRDVKDLQERVGQYLAELAMERGKLHLLDQGSSASDP